MSHKITKYTKDLLEPLVRESSSYAEILQKLGLKPYAGGNIQNLKRNIAILGLDTAHFSGQGWNAGKTHKKDARIHKSYSDEEIFSFPSPIKGSIAGTLKPRLIQLGFPYQCNNCGLKDSWLGKPITIELHHRNGNRLDNRVENLEFLCPNCHSQTDTHRGKNIPRAKKEKIKKERFIPPSGPEPLCIDREDFHTLLWLYTLSDLSILFNVTHVSIGKWARKHNIDYPSHSYWRKKGVKDDYDLTPLYLARKIHESGAPLTDAVKFILSSTQKPLDK